MNPLQNIPKSIKTPKNVGEGNQENSAAVRPKDDESGPKSFASSVFRAIASEGDSLYAEIAAVAAVVERDEYKIKERLISLAECGDTNSVIRILREWATKPPREVLETCVEPDNGSGG